MKKIFAFLLSFVMVFALTACEQDKPTDKTPDRKPTEQVAPTEPQPEEYEDEEIEVLAEPGSLKEPVAVFNQDGIRIIFTKLEKVDFSDHSVYRLHYEISNENEFDICFAVPNISINGIMFDGLNGLIFETVAAGNSITATDDICCEDLAAVGISEIRNIKSFDGDVWGTDGSDYTAKVTFELDCGDMTYRTGLKKSGKVVYDKDGLKLIYKGLEDGNREGSKVATILVVNESDKHLSLDWNNIDVNGVNTNEWNFAYVYAGTGNYAKIIWLDAEIEALGGELETIDFLMSIWNLNASDCYGQNIEIAFDL